MATTSVTPDGRAHVLADGNHMPMLGLGVWQVPDGPECVNAVRWALELGYRHIDTAQAYGNEDSVGRGLRESGVPRDEVYITTKFYPGHSDPAARSRPAALSGSGSTTSTSTSCTGPKAAPSGPGRVWNTPTSWATPGRSVYRISMWPSCRPSWPPPPSRRPSTRSSSARSSTGAGCWRRPNNAPSSSRPTARSGRPSTCRTAA